MNYGNPKAVAGGTLVLTGFTLGQQIAICTAAVIFIGCLAVLVRRVWRHKKNLGDK